MKHLICSAAKILCALSLLGLLGGCIRFDFPQKPQRYSVSYYDVFDTVTTFLGPAESRKAFDEQADVLHDRLLELHRLFDIYHNYEGIMNLKTLNDRAALEPVAVGEDIVELLEDCRIWAELTEGRARH